jgi:hypothetical protein
MDMLKHCKRCNKWTHELNHIGVCARCNKELEHYTLRIRFITELVSLYTTIDTIKNQSDKEILLAKFDRVVSEANFIPQEQQYFDNELNQKGI